MSDASSLNDQIQDAVQQINAAAGGVDRGLIAAAAYQAIAQAIALAMQNAVAQQQQGYILRNALTAAAASAILDGKKEEANSVLSMMESRLVSPGIASEIADLLAALKMVDAELRRFNQSAPAAEPVSPEPASPEPASPEPASPEPASPEPASPEPASPEPASPEPAQAPKTKGAPRRRAKQARG